MIIAIPEPLREKLGPDGARALAELLNEAAVQTRGDVIGIAADRFERRLAAELGQFPSEVHQAIGTVRPEIHAEIGKLRSEMPEEIGKLRSETHAGFGSLRAEMGAFESRIVRWMFIFWIGQVAALLGILFAFFRG